MATAAQERARLRGIVRRESPALEREMERVSTRTLQVLAQLIRQSQREMRVGIRLGNAWRRPPPKGFAERVRMAAGGGRPEPGAGTSTFHFALNQSGSADAAAAHQSDIEREQACVASFGNIADDPAERIRLWRELGRRAKTKRGSIRFGPGTSPEVRAVVRDRIGDWARAGRVPHRVAAQLRRTGDAMWEGGEGVRVWTFDLDDHKAVATWVWLLARAVDEEGDDDEGGADRADEDDAAAGSSQTPLPGIDGPDGAGGKPAGPAQPRPRRRLPKGVREHLPRRTVLQRQLVVELAHELPLAAQERALRSWCEQHLGAAGVAWHAVIHQPEGKNDVHNWHAHIVYANVEVRREVDRSGVETGRFEFERDPNAMPPVVPLMRELGGNTAKGRRGVVGLIKKWRKGMADAQNWELALAGEEKRYDHRSYRAQGIDREGGQHRGTKRSALVSSGRASDHWSRASPEWTQLARDVEDALEEAEVPIETRARIRERLETARLELGLRASSDPEGCRLAHAASAAVDAGEEVVEHERPKPPAGMAARLIEAITGGREAARYPPAVPEWRIAWGEVQREVAGPLRRDAAASAIAARYPGGAPALAADAAPDARAVAAGSRRHEARQRAWRAAWSEAERLPEERARVRALRGQWRALAEQGLRPEPMLGPKEREAARETIRRLERAERARELARRAEVEARTRVDPDAIERALERLAGPEREALVDAHGEPEAQKRIRDLRVALAAAAVRRTWREACARGEEGMVHFLHGAGRDPRWPATPGLERAALAMLTEDERAAMARAAAAPAHVLEEHRTVRAEAGAVLDALAPQSMRAPLRGPRPETVAEWLSDPERNARLAGHAPEVWATLEAAREACAARERDAAGKLAGAGLDANDLTRTERSLARMDTETRLALAGLDPDAAAHAVPRVWEQLCLSVSEEASELGERILSHGDGAEDDLAIITQVKEGEAALLERLAFEEQMGAEAAQRWRDAAERERWRTERLHETLETAVAGLTGGAEPVERRRRQKHVREMLRRAPTRRRIGEAAARRYEERAGLRDRDWWRDSAARRG